MKKSVLLLTVIVLLSAVCYAEIMDTKLFNINVEPVQDTILDMEKGYGEYYINIENRWTEPETFKLVFLDPPVWGEQLIPNPNQRELTVPAGETKQFHFYVKPSDAPEGVNSISAIIRSETTGITFRKGFKVQYGEKAEPAVITPPQPSMNISASVPARIDPRNPYTFVVDIANENSRFLQNVTVKLKSKVFSDTAIVDVDPDGKKGVSFAVLLDEDQPPQEDQLQITVSYDGKVFYDQSHNFAVVEYSSAFRKDIAVEEQTWKRIRTMTITNNGNTEKTDSIRLPTTLREQIFSNSDPKYHMTKEDGTDYMTWDMTLAPGESQTITVTTSYRLLLLLIIAILLYFAYLAKKMKPVIVKKKFKSVKKAHGAISEMTVAIFLKNTGKKPVTNIRVVERITKMVMLKKDSFDGSMHPVKMHSHAQEGTLLEYRFAELGPGDERIITYKVYSRLHMFGDVIIKPTVIEYKKKSGAKTKSKSNQIAMSTEKEEK